MPESPAPHLIIGQGLAGTALAWHLWQRGVPFLIVDRDEPVTSSKIAAGLLTPITGMRLSLSENYGPWLREAMTFYRHKERLLGQRFLHARPHVRLFKNDEEPKRWAKRASTPEVQPFVKAVPPDPLVSPDVFHAPRGGFQMRHSGYLDTAAFLNSSKAWFAKHGQWVAAECRLEDLQVSDHEVHWRDQRFQQVTFCTGWEAMKHPWFDWVPFEPARGTILTARANLDGERRIINGGCWLLARPDGTLRIGSTYETRFVHPHGADEAKVADLHARISRLVRVPVEILLQQSAVRPIIARQRTLIGRHPARPRVSFFNGLGSKGTLRAPAFASALASHLLNDTPLPLAMDLNSNL